MQFRNSSYHKSSSIEQLASNFSALEYIFEFRRRHKVFVNVLIIAVIAIIIAMIVLYMNLLSPKNQTSNNSVGIDIHQPTDVNTENYIEHMRTDDGLFKSTVTYEFGTAFLLNEGFKEGDICSLRINVIYRGITGDLRSTEDNLLPSIVVGNYVTVTSVILDPDGFVSVDDIVGYNIK